MYCNTTYRCIYCSLYKNWWWNLVNYRSLSSKTFNTSALFSVYAFTLSPKISSKQLTAWEVWFEEVFYRIINSDEITIQIKMLGFWLWENSVSRFKYIHHPIPRGYFTTSTLLLQDVSYGVRWVRGGGWTKQRTQFRTCYYNNTKQTHNFVIVAIGIETVLLQGLSIPS